MSHWYTQGQLGTEHRGDLDRESARESLRSQARASGPTRPGIVSQGFVRLGRIVGDPASRLASFRRHAGSAVVERPIAKPRPAATGIHR